jgi:hypothetical protein
MKQLKLQHGYHDALIRGVSYRDDEDVVLEVGLCSCCNPSTCAATLSLLGLRNSAEVLAALEAATSMRSLSSGGRTAGATFST